jgi:hypothetical protein
VLRTFGFTKDVESMRANGLARWAVYNAIAAGRLLASLQCGGLQYASRDEFVKHRFSNASGRPYVRVPLLASYSAFAWPWAEQPAVVNCWPKFPDAWDNVTLRMKKLAPKDFRNQQGLVGFRPATTMAFFRAPFCFAGVIVCFWRFIHNGDACYSDTWTDHPSNGY